MGSLFEINGTTGQIKIEDGTVSALALTFISDTNTGIYRVGADDLALATGGTQALEINSTQQIVVPKTSNQFIIGTTNTTTLSFTAPAASRTYTIPAVIDSSFVMTNGTQTLNDDITFSNQKGIILQEQTGNGSNYVKIEAADSLTADTTYKLPKDSTAGYILSTDGSGNLSWISPATAGGWTDYGAYVELTTTTDQVRVGAGAAATPSITFTGDTNTGIYSVGADQLAFSTNSTLRFDISTTAVTSTLPIVHPLGAAATPSITFTGDTNTGIYSGSADVVNISSGGTNAFAVFTDGTHINTGQLFLQSGSVGAPALTFAGDTNTGIYRSSAGIIKIVNSGTARYTFDTTSFTVATGMLISGDAIKLENGAAATPVYSFTSDTNTGIYRVGAEDIGIATDGTLRFDISTTAVTSTLPIVLPLGAAATPSITFTGDTNTGIYSDADVLRFSTAGTQRVNISTTNLNTTLPILLPGGTSTAPAITFAGDDNTGIWSGTSDVLRMGTGGNANASITINDTGVAILGRNGGTGWGIEFQTGTATGASTATLTNSPTAGNPAGWLKITVNGANKYIPYWS